MLASDVIRCWGRILAGYRPELTVEVTRECPLRCPGCYAYAPEHVGGVALRSVADLKGDALVDGIVQLVGRHRPLHVTLVGGEPLVRYREMEAIIPRLLADPGLHIQVVTSAVRPIPAAWASERRLNVSVSIDGLPAEHDVRRKPATYDRILQHIDGQHVTVHCTITGQQMKREGYLEEFVRFWSEQPSAKRIWVSLYTPQLGEASPERLTEEERNRAVDELIGLRPRYPKLDMGPIVLRQLRTPPTSPRECSLVRLATCISADLETPITPCQLGGVPDCSNCGCMAAAGIGAVERYKLFGVIPLKVLVDGSQAVGAVSRRMRGTANGKRSTGREAAR